MVSSHQSMTAGWSISCGSGHLHAAAAAAAAAVPAGHPCGAACMPTPLSTRYTLSQQRQLQQHNIQEVCCASVQKRRVVLSYCCYNCVATAVLPTCRFVRLYSWHERPVMQMLQAHVSACLCPNSQLNLIGHSHWHPPADTLARQMRCQNGMANCYWPECITPACCVLSPCRRGQQCSPAAVTSRRARG
jgi:hypothetical protein